MGAVAAIVRWDAGPVEAAHLARMSRAAPCPALERTTSAAGGQVAMARLPAISSDAGAQPLVDESRGLWVLFDGRLDNRDDLVRALDAGGPSAPDASLVLEAFARWGTAAGSRLLGDFAFIAWDSRRRRLVACRDHFGIRPLHYHASPARFVCASYLSQVLAHPAVPSEPDPATVADHLAGDVRNGSATLYRTVCRLPPGHSVIAEPGRVTLERYWAPEPRTALRYRDDHEYAAQCRELLTRSVEARLRSDRPVAAQLSGGLDSSSVVCIAHRAAAAPAGPPRPFSLIYPAHPESDERPYIRAVLDHCGASGVDVLPVPPDAEALWRGARESASTPSMPADESASPLYAAIREAGCHAALTGAGGDFLFSGSVFQYADLLRGGRPLAALRRFAADWRADDTGRSPLGLLQAGAWPLLPARVRRGLRPLARRALGLESQPSWLKLVPSAPREFPEAPRGDSFATEEVVRLLGSGMHAFFLECGDRAAARHGVELRHPLLDVRLVQFALDLPDDQRRRGPFTKFVLREALASDLPDVVRTRRTKADFSHVVAAAFEALGGAGFFGRLAIADAGWVDGGALLARYRLMQSRYAQGPDAYGDHVPVLWMTAAVELWYRAAFTERRGPSPAGPVY